MAAQLEPCIPIGVSSCLLGEPVRYDGGHKKYPGIEFFRHRFVLVSLCPEMAIGLGVPRPPIHLVGNAQHFRAVEVMRPALDYSLALQRYGQSVARRQPKLYGYLLKSRSPSCGLQGVPVYAHQGQAIAEGAGIYAGTLVEESPEMPRAEECCLEDEPLRRQFAAQILRYYRATA